MQAPDGPCAAIPTRGGRYGPVAATSTSEAQDAGAGAGEPQRAQEAAADPFQARIWTGP